MEKCTPNEVLENIENKDTTVEVIGYVDQIIIRPIKSEGKKNFRFFLNNANGKRVQVTTWADNPEKIKEIEKLVHSVNLIVHLNGALANIPREIHFNKGNVPYELIIKRSTAIEIEGMYKKHDQEITINTIELKDCEANIEKNIRIIGNISCTLRELNGRYSTYIVGSITDGYYKIEIRCNNIHDPNPTEFTFGTLVEITGVIQKQKMGSIYIKLTNSNHIKEIRGEKMSFEKILLGFHNV